MDRYVVDGVLNVLSAWTLDAGDRLRRIQSGQPQDYVYGVAFGVCSLLARVVPLARVTMTGMARPAPIITWAPFVARRAHHVHRPPPASLLVRCSSVVSTGLCLVLSHRVYVAYDREAAGFQFYEELALVPPLGIKYQLGVDGMSLLMVLLTSIIIFAGSFASWTVKERSQEFYALLLLLVTGVYGVFVSLDLFVLFLFYEIAVLPMYLLIGIWGSRARCARRGSSAGPCGGPASAPRNTRR